jgi:hypothetical protein
VITVSKLNGEVYEKTNDATLCPFEFRGDGDEQIITFFGLPIWSSAEDYGTDFESLEVFIRRKSQKVLEQIMKLHFLPTPK